MADRQLCPDYPGEKQIAVAQDIVCMNTADNVTWVLADFGTGQWVQGLEWFVFLDDGGSDSDPNTGLGWWHTGASNPEVGADCSNPPVGFIFPNRSGSFEIVDSFEVLPPPLLDKDQCKNGGYATYGFANQGQCIAYTNQPRAG